MAFKMNLWCCWSFDGLITALEVLLANSPGSPCWSGGAAPSTSDAFDPCVLLAPSGVVSRAAEWWPVANRASAEFWTCRGSMRAPPAHNRARELHECGPPSYSLGYYRARKVGKTVPFALNAKRRGGCLQIQICGSSHGECCCVRREARWTQSLPTTDAILPFSGQSTTASTGCFCAGSRSYPAAGSC